MKIPQLDLKPQYAQIRTEIEAAVQGVLESQHFIYGPEVSGLEQEVAAYCQAAHGIACASGSDALYLALLALGLKPGDEVLCPAFTFFATAGAVTRVGATPVFADIDPQTYNLTPALVAEAAGACRRLKAIIVVHLFGRCAPMAGLEDLARELGAALIEDAAQAIGSEDLRGRRAGSMGLLGCLSFYPTKNLGGIGDGGMLTTQDPELADRLRLLREHGARPKYIHRLAGTNSRLDAIQAAALRVKLRHLDRWTANRQRNARSYDRLFTERLFKASPAQGGALVLPAPCEAGARQVFNQYVIRVPGGRRDGLREYLKGQEIGSEVYYPLPLHLQECFAHLGYRRGQLPHSELAAQEVLALPMYPELSEPQIEEVVSATCRFLSPG